MRGATRSTCLAAILLGSTVLARAEIGMPAAPGGVYVGVGSGYHHENGSNVAAQGTTSTGPGNGPGTGPQAGGFATNTNTASTNGTTLSSSNGTSAAAFAGGAGATNGSTSVAVTSGPSGTASASSASGGPGVVSATAGTATNTSTVAGGANATQATASSTNTVAGTSASAAAAGSYGAFAATNAGLAGSAGVAQAGGLGATASASAADANTSVASSSDGGSFLRAQSGAFGDVEIGYVLPAALYGVTRVELFAAGSMASQNSSVQGGLGFRGVDNASAFAVAASPFGSLTGGAFQRDNLGEIGLRIKADRRIGAVQAALSAEPFYLDFRQLTTSYAGGANSFGQRTSSVHGKLYGAQLGAEAVLPVLSRVSLVGRASVGIYGVQSSGAFSSTIASTAGAQTAAALAATGAANAFPPLVAAAGTVPVGDQFAGAAADSSSRVGALLGAQAGVRYAISPRAWFTVLGSVDYLSDVPTAVLPRYTTDRAAHLASRGYVDLRIGGRLTVATLGAP